MISRKARSSLILTVGSILTVFGTILLVAIASGYRINIFSGDVTTTGLIIMGSNPTGADISVNSKPLMKKTPHRIQNADIGPTQIKYTKENYYDWNSEFIVRGGEVVFADYALLIEKNIQPKSIENIPAITSLLNSQTKDRMFAFSDLPVSIYEISTDFKTTRLKSLESIKSPKKFRSIQPVQTNLDGSVVIARITFEDDSSQVFWLSSQSEESHNISELYGEKFGQLSINPKNPRELLSLTQGKITRLNVESRASTDLPISNVNSFAFDGDNIYTLEKLEPVEKGQFLVRYDANGNNRYVLYQYGPASNPWSIILTRLAGEPIIAIHDNDSEKQLFVLKKVSADYQSSTVGSDTRLPSFSPNGRFLSFVQADKIRTIDLEFTDRFVATHSNIENMRWLTNFQRVVSRPDGLYIVDYNGFNFIKIPPNGGLAQSFSVQGEAKNILFIDAGKVFGYSLQSREGLINFR